MKKNLFLLLLGCNSFIYAQNVHEFPVLKGDYLGQKPPGDSAVVFARGIVSTDYQEHGAPVFSPDGNEVFWSTNQRPKSENEKWINSRMTMRRIGDTWTEPEISPFDQTPIISPNGKRLYFESKGEGKDPGFVEKQGNGWSQPQFISLVTRFPEVREAFNLQITNNGTLYFVGYVEGLGTFNNYGIYRTELINGEYAKPHLLPRSINLPPFLNWTPFIAPDESYIIFSSSRRTSDYDRGDLYISFHKKDGNWTYPVSLGPTVNTNLQERFPVVSPDGKYLFFSRWTPDHDEDAFWMSSKIIDDIKEKPNVANPISDQLAFVNRKFTLKIQGNTFSDYSDTLLNYSARTQNGGPLPDWISFNPKTCTFTGTPSGVQVLNISLTVENSEMKKCTDNFEITVIKNQAHDTNKIDLKNDLIVNYPFNGDSNDKSIHKYKGEVNGAIFCADRKGKEKSACFFDGENDFIKVENIKELDIIGSLTVSCWIKPQSYYSRASAWVSKQNVNKSNSQFRFGFGWEPQNNWGFTSYKYDWNDYNFNNTIPLDKWSFVSFTLNVSDSTLIFYLNGESVKTMKTKELISYSNGPLYIGYQADDNCYFHGSIDDFKIYSRVLNHKEVLALYRDDL
jgi:hypothetical protein